jgi:hypothetical protein
MTFFYNLNKKLDEIRATPELTHKQLNERDMSRAAKGYDKYDNKEVDEGLGDMARKVGGAVKKVAGKALDTIGHGSDADMIRDLQKKMGVPQTGMKPGSEPNPKQVKEKMNPAKTKSFAALAEPKDKITFADKIAGAKKEVDEMLGDVAAEAMKNALSGGQKKLDKNNNGKLDANDFAMLRKGANKNQGGVDEASTDNAFTAHKRPRIEKPAVGTVTHGSKHDVEEIPGGRRVTRRVDPNTGHSVGADDSSADGEKRGRGRPKGSKAAIGAKGPSGKSKLMTKEAASEDDIQILVRMRDEAFEDGNKMLGNKIEDILQMLDKDEEQVSEKAVSKKQQRFMGMVHAAQKGEKPASKEVAKVAKGMGKKDAEDFAATKHKGLPEKKKPEAKKDDAPKKKKTEEAGGTGTPTASSGFSYGKGIYDSLDRDVEAMIAEGMNVSMNMNSDAQGGPSKSLTVTATDDDALKLSELLKNAGLGGGDEHGYGGTGYKSACGCGTSDCSCGDQEVDEAYGDNAVSQNEPNWPTNTETSDDALQYSGGLNKPKSTGQTTVPVIASQEERQESYAEAEEDAIKRMMEMAGVKKKEVDEEKTEEGNLFTGNLAKARADGKKEADLDGDGKMEKVDEGILAATANLWKEYKGKHGV